MHIEHFQLAKNRKPSDVFKIISLDESFGIQSERRENVSLLDVDYNFVAARSRKKPTELEQTREWDSVLRVIKERYPSEVASTFSSKKRRDIKKRLSAFEYDVFCHYCTTCRRGVTESKNKKKKRALRYETYINSPLWTRVKNTYYQKHGRRCAACLSSKHVQLHHMSYKNLGNEADEALVALCDDHHKEYHQRYGIQKDMTATTHSFIQDVKNAMR